MGIPVYLAVQNEAAINYPKKYLAQTGYGLRRDGHLRIPVHTMNCPVIIDDAVMGWQEKVLKSLAVYCRNGYILDFERPFNAEHRKIINALPQNQLLALPAAFHTVKLKALPVFSCPVPCNSWRGFLQKCQQQFQNGWMLEITPWDQQKYTGPGEDHGILPQSICAFSKSGGKITYFDTKKTICEKLEAAQSFGCMAAIALYDEVKALRK